MNSLYKYQQVNSSLVGRHICQEQKTQQALEDTQ
jgi:hypothetical protein